MMPSSIASASAAYGAEENGVQSVLDTEMDHNIAPDRNQPPPSYWDRFQTKLRELKPSQAPDECCIYRVPKAARDKDKAAYTPQVVTIGPFHRGREGSESMEKLKLRYFKHSLSRLGLRWEDCVYLVKQCEQDVCDCYAEEISGLDTDEFVEMIVVDSGFIVELFLRDRQAYFVDADDNFIGNPTVRSNLLHDLTLVENQIPMFIIRALYDPILTTNREPCVLELAISFFSEHNMQSLQPESCNKVLHFADLIRTFFKPQSPRTAGSQREILVFKYVNSATQLHDAGLKFKVSPSNCFLDIKLENGVLEIPCLNVYDATKPLLKNLMALEVCHYPYHSYILDYVIFMDLFIDTIEDVDLLIEEGIIVSWLGQSLGVATFFNNATTHFSLNSRNFYFSQLCHDLNAFYKGNWNRWKTTLNREYFGNPWKTVSTAAHGAEENGVQSGLDAEMDLNIAPDRSQPPPSYWDQFETRLRELKPSQAPGRCCIYRVPKAARDIDETAYTPRVVSIGPFHRGREGLKSLENLKLRYFKNSLSRLGLRWQDCFYLVKQCEQDIRDCYAEEISGLDTDEFVEMILVDSGFIVELFLREREDFPIDADDNFTTNPTVITSLSHDLKLLENQIPMAIIRFLYDRSLTTNSKPRVLELAISFFSRHNMQRVQPDSCDNVLHFADLIRTFSKPQSPRTAGSQREIPVFKYVNSATQLHDAGLKFKVCPSNCFLDIKLEKGVLEIPCLDVYDSIKPLLKNLMALEVCHYPNDSYILDYVIFMDFLMDTIEDVDLLIEEGIIVSRLGQSLGVATFFNNATTHFSLNSRNFYFSQLCHDLNAFYKGNWNRWKTTLNREYFGNPWKTVSTAAHGAEENGVQSGLDAEMDLNIAPDRSQPPPSYWDQFETRLRELKPSQAPGRCCIYRVPKAARDIDETAYTPRVVSIGPFHRGREGLKSLENLKLRYFKNSLSRLGLRWQDCFYLVKQCEQDIRDCYAEEISGLDTDEFVEMILVDSGFIVELFLREREAYFIDADDDFTTNPTVITSLSHDLKLLENQIPMAIIRFLYDRSLTTNSKPRVLELAISFFSRHNMQRVQPDSCDNVLHFADLIRTFSKPQSPRTAGSQREIPVFKYVNSATQLHDAGLKFKVCPSNCFLDIKLEKGVLEIPCLDVYDSIKPLLKNLMALEVCHYPNDSYILDYVIFMDFLMDTIEDVDLLIEEGIIVSRLGQSLGVATFFNNATTHFSLNSRNFYFSQLCHDLNAFYKGNWNRWKTTLNREYFGNPWKTVSTAAHGAEENGVQSGLDAEMDLNIAPDRSQPPPSYWDQFETRLRELKPSQAPGRCCIYRVPKAARDIDETAYTPRVVSIGPFHRGREGLKSLENLKLRYFKNSLSRLGLRWQDCFYLVKQCEQDIRDCYAEEISGLDTDEFVEMILVDSGFIVELFLREREAYFIDADDDFTTNPTVITSLSHDLKLLENQIPMAIIRFLYDRSLTTNSKPRVLELAISFFSRHNMQRVQPDSCDNVLHFADLIRTFSKPQSPRTAGSQREIPVFKYVNSATQLHNAGLKFKVCPSKCLLDIKLEKGVLEIPCLDVYDSIKPLLKNLMALEVCHYPNDSYILDYVIFMDFLMDTIEDVDLLIEEGIIVSRLGQSLGVATFFNNATTHFSLNSRNFYFSQLCHDLNAFYKGNWNRWKTTLNREYFGNPWKTVSTAAHGAEENGVQSGLDAEMDLNIAPDRSQPPPSYWDQFETRLRELKPSQAPGRCCIYRVPKAARDIDETAYTPRVVSIGPFHRGREGLKSLENLKLRYFKNSLSRLGLRWQDCFYLVKQCEQDIRDCYAEEISGLDTDEFVEMILVDSGFIVELFLREREDFPIDADDNITTNPTVITSLSHDLKLLENQIPMAIIRFLYDRSLTTNSKPRVLELAISFFSRHNMQRVQPDSCDNVLHFADLIRTFSKPQSPRTAGSQREIPVFKYVNSATQLHDAGLKFKVCPSNCFLDIKLEKGVLEIPCLDVYDSIKPLLKNLMALEVCHYPNDSYILDYVIFMDFLMDTIEDVDLLIEEGIIVSRLGQSLGVATFFNNATTHFSLNSRNFYFSQLCHDLNAFYKGNWNRWKTTLNREYFGNPWKTVSTAAHGAEENGVQSGLDAEMDLNIAPDRSQPPPSYWDQFETRLRELKPSQAPGRCCIYRVPKAARDIDETAYTPRVVSIGPFHRGREGLKSLEKLKLRYFKKSLSRLGLRWQDCFYLVKQCEQDIRDCYAEEISGLDTDEFVEMILVDSGFIVELFLREREAYFIDADDDFTTNPTVITSLSHDLKLLENQIPMAIIRFLYDRSLTTNSKPRVLELAISFFSRHNMQRVQPDSCDNVLHFADLIRTFSKPQSPRTAGSQREIPVFKYVNSATQLHNAGLKFKVCPSKCLLDIKLENGVLEIPCLDVYDSTKPLLKNLMALEVCHYPYDSYMD
ncbi:hypothetical protein RJ640_022428 [Escallonia rubra]|uniref:Uncharacterized protein n=1 Tax=Escallonia rubra TaxID=112253 RepID=A0AA88RCX5_9ASTE|nr:hypothetical protein RJ640_022428 [Escallonia rubra]